LLEGDRATAAAEEARVPACGGMTVGWYDAVGYKHGGEKLHHAVHLFRSSPFRAVPTTSALSRFRTI